MKKIFLSQLVFALVLVTTAFKPAADETFTVDTDKSSVAWLAKKVTGQHNGTIQLSSGSLMFTGKSLKGGTFVADMNTLKSTDGAGARLDNHLKADDFFGVAKNPTSTFKITKVTAAGSDRVNITGDFTIKGITNSITFPATVKRADNVVVATAAGVKIDRTKYDIRYGSKSFFESIGDKAIDDEFELSINLVARK